VRNGGGLCRRRTPGYRPHGRSFLHQHWCTLPRPGFGNGSKELVHTSGAEYPREGRRQLWQRLLPFGCYAVGAGLLAHLLRHVDLIYAPSTPPLLAGLWGSYFKQLRRLPFVYNSRTSIRYRCHARRPEKSPPCPLGTSPRATASASSRSGNGSLRRHAPTHPSGRPHLIQCACDPQLDGHRAHSPNSPYTQPLSPHTGSRRKICSALFRQFGHAHPCELLPELAARLHDLPDLVLLIIETGPNKAALVERVSDLRLKNVRFFPYQSKANLAETLSAADVSSFSNVRQTRVSLFRQSSTASSQAVDLSSPQLRAKVKSRAFLTRYDTGLAVGAQDCAECACAVRMLYSDPQRREQLGAHGRQLAVEHFDRKILTARYRDLFLELL